MSKKPLLSLIIPAYNEAGKIEATLNESIEYLEQRRVDYEIFVSADGNDGTREIASKLSTANTRIRVIGSSERGGKGKGIRNAVTFAKGKWIGFIDADNKTPITEFDKFIPYLEQGIEIVIGSRGDIHSVIERPQPWYRQIGSKGFRVLMHAATGLWEIADTQCGFKFFQEYVAKDLFRRQQIDGYIFDVEILYLAKLAHYCVQQVPIRWRDDRDSRLNLVKGNFENLIDVLSIRFRHYSSCREAAQQ